MDELKWNLKNVGLWRALRRAWWTARLGVFRFLKRHIGFKKAKRIIF
jgi:hypothetical protein